jgi:C_GCAxxG_C_C family probable redox protein
MADLGKALDIALEEYLNRAHCAEVVFKNVTKALRPDFDQSLVRIATPFGGGIADAGDTCGALIGGLMVIGYLHGRSRLNESDKYCWKLSQEYYRAFKESLGSTTCYGIRGQIFNWDTHVKCSETVRQAFRLLEPILEAGESEHGS